jgi:hypothetical protein
LEQLVGFVKVLLGQLEAVNPGRRSGSSRSGRLAAEKDVILQHIEHVHAIGPLKTVLVLVSLHEAEEHVTITLFSFWLRLLAQHLAEIPLVLVYSNDKRLHWIVRVHGSRILFSCISRVRQLFATFPVLIRMQGGRHVFDFILQILI